MKKNIPLIPFLAFLISLPAFASAEEARLLAFSGNVEVRTTREGQWTPAAEKAEIPEGGAVRTGADGGAVVLLPNKSKVWLREASALEIEQRQTLASRLALLFGRIKVRVPHLMRKEKFEVRTPAAVCAVRGTEFTVETTETGAMSINVLYGEVKLNFVVPPEKGEAQVYIPQGRNLSLEEKGKQAKVAMMTPEQEKSALENWDPGLSLAERQRGLKEKENDRAQVREFAKVTSGTENSVKTFLNVVKESDIETGRTLKDIHGNVVRVAQLLMRPHSDEIQFVNLVKRPSYNAINNNSVNGGFNYNGGSVDSRLDYVQLTMNFNRDLPQSIEQWPDFFSGNDVKPDWASFVSANRTNASEILFVASLLKYDAVKDDLVNNSTVIGLPLTAVNGGDRDVIVTGVIKDEVGVRAIEGLDRISRLQVQDNGNKDGGLVYTADGVTTVGVAANEVVWAMKLDNDAIDAMDSHLVNGSAVNGSASNIVTNYEKKGDPNMFNYSAQAYLVGNNAGHAWTDGAGGPGNLYTYTPGASNDIIWFANESYIIDNSGSLRSVDSLVNSSQDPFSLFKNVAGESVMSIKKSLGGWDGRINWTSNTAVFNDIDNTDYFTHGYGNNIDVVFIPDLFMAAVQRMLPAISKLNN